MVLWRQMLPDPPETKQYGPFLFVTIAALLSFAALFVFRADDDNRLFAWQWVFAGERASGVFLLLVPGLIAAYALSQASFLEQKPRAFLLLFSFLAASLFWAEPELIVDASRYFTQAKHLEVYGIPFFFKEWGRLIPAWTDLPAMPFLYGLIFSAFGESRILIQIFTTLLFSSTVVLTYLIGKTLWDKETGFIAGLLLLGMPYLLTQVPLMLVDVPTMFFLVLSIYTFMKALELGGAPMSALSSLALFFTAFTKYSTLPMLSVLAVVLAVYARKDPGAALRRSAAVLLLSGFMITVVVLLKFGVFVEQIRLLRSFQQPGLTRWGESFFSTFFFQIHPFISLAAAYALVAAIRDKDWKFAIISWLVALIFVFVVRRIRYVLPVFPLVALMGAYGLRRVEVKGVRRFVVFVIVFFSLITSFFAYRPFARSMSAENLKEAGEYLNAGGIEAVEVMIRPPKDPVANLSVSVPLFDLYVKKSILYRYYPELFPSPDDVATNSLRFTWEYRNPEYYSGDLMENDKTALVVISGEAEGVFSPALQKRTRGYRLSKSFVIASDPFLYKTFVDIYTKERHPIE